METLVKTSSVGSVILQTVKVILQTSKHFRFISYSNHYRFKNKDFLKCIFYTFNCVNFTQCKMFF